jgi:hypothetical protein
MATYVSINKHVIARNARHGTSDPPIRVSKGKSGEGEYFPTAWRSKAPHGLSTARVALSWDAVLVWSSSPNLR